MKPVQTLWQTFGRINASGSRTARPKVRRAAACEPLEDRQLLNAAWSPLHELAGWDGALIKGNDAPAHVFTLDAKTANGLHRAGHSFRVSASTSAAPGQSFTGLSTQLQTDFQTLQTDQKALQAEIPASLTAAVKADQAVIQQAISSLTPTQLKTLHSGQTQSGTASSSNPTANLTATLTAAGVSSSEINTITTDLQNLKNAYTTTDPALQAKIAADEAAIVKDGGPTISASSHGFGM